MVRMGYTGMAMDDLTAPRLDDDLLAFAAGEEGRFGDAGRQRILLALLHLIVDGTPVAAADVATAAGVRTDTVEATVADLPPAWFETHDDGRLVGFGGLTQIPTRHHIDFGSRTLYAWCAFDCLFLPALLDRPLAISSTCPATQNPVRLVARHDGVEDVSPSTAVMSFVIPEEAARRQNLRQVFCAHINFYASPAAAAAWSAATENGKILELDTAGALARRRNQAAFDAVLPA